jgi:nucleoside-diphosphate-sugar epimerase
LLTERSCYAAAKRIGEELVAAARAEGVDAASLRLFNVYGPGMDPTLPGYGRVVPNFIRAAAGGKPLTIHGDGGQVRSFLWIADLVAAVRALLGHPEPLPPVVNVGCDEPVTIEQLAATVEHVVGRWLGRRHSPRMPDDPDWRRPDCSLLRSLTDWSPRTSLAEGLRRVLAADVDAAREGTPTACLRDGGSGRHGRGRSTRNLEEASARLTDLQGDPVDGGATAGLSASGAARDVRPQRLGEP